MIDFPVLSLLTFLPLIGVAFILTIRGDEAIVARNARNAALFTSAFTLALALFMVMRFDPSAEGFQFVEKVEWIPSLGISYHVGVDGISVFFVLLSAFLTPVCLIASRESIRSRVREYMVAFLVLETFMIGTFVALDAVLFYVFFEGVLIPMFLIIGIWGGPRRVYASYKFFLFTLLGSVLMLVALLAIRIETGTTDIPTLMHTDISHSLQFVAWWAFFASFAVKMPMWPVHTWLPDAHVEAPTAGSVILAGVLLKMGGYGFLRFSIPMFPEMSENFAPIVFWMSVTAIVYTSLVALAQEDMKKMIAYSSVAHMGFVTLGIFTVTEEGVQGAVFQMLSHGLISAALFLCVGVVYDRLHTREIGRYGGLVNNMPNYAVVFMVLMLGSVGLPGTSGFVGEFLSLLGAYRVDTTVAVFASTGLVLGAAYMLLLYRRVVFGPQHNADAAAMPDLDMREIAMFVPILALVLWLGVFPSTVTTYVAPATRALVERYEQANDEVEFAGQKFRLSEIRVELVPKNDLPMPEESELPHENVSEDVDQEDWEQDDWEREDEAE